MIYIGLDVHKKRTKVAMVDDRTGQLHKPYDVATRELIEHLKCIQGDKCIAMEAADTSMFLARKLEACGLDARVVDARKAHLLMHGLQNAKTDKLDATSLCLLLAKDMLDTARVWVPDESVNELRELVRARDSVMRQSVSVQNRIRKFLGRQGLDCPLSDLAGRDASSWLDETQKQLPATLAIVLDSWRKALAFEISRLDELTQAIEQAGHKHPGVALLQTIPGVGVVLSAIIVSQIGRWQRFPNACKLRGYSGLVPRISQSGEKSRTGPLVSTGNKLLRWALIQAAQNFARSRQTRGLKVIRNYNYKVHKHGPNPAKVDLARHLTDIIYAMLRDGTRFDPKLLCQAQAA